VRGIEGTDWVAAGAGFGWTSDPTKGLVFKIDESGRVVETYETGLGAGFMGFTDGRLWVANRDEGTVTGIDAVTGARTVFGFDHPTETLAAGGGSLLVYVVPGSTVSTFADALPVPKAMFLAALYQLGQGDEPALNTYPGAIQIDNATCAQLLRHADRPGPGDGPLYAEVATAMPTVSRDGKTYTFTIREGYQFSPPSNQAVTAGTFRYSIERALSPRMAHNPTGQVPPGPLYVTDIEGERAFRSRIAEHISGIKARGDVLQITLVEPAPDFLERISLPYFCPVPLGTPFVAGGPVQETAGGSQHSIPSAGPYYVSDYVNGEYVVLQRNPHYPGLRETHFETIAMLEGVGATTALEWVDERGWDGVTSIFDPALAPGGAVDERWGAGSLAAEQGQQQYFLTALPRTRMFAFNSARGIFSHRWARKAAALVLDREAFSTALGYQPSDQILPPAVSRVGETPVLQPKVERARTLMHGRTGQAATPVPPGCGDCFDVANIAKENLAQIGIELVIRRTEPARGDSQAWKSFDMADVEIGLPYPDSASLLRQVLADVPAGWLAPRMESQILDVTSLDGHKRHRHAVTLADDMAGGEVSVVAFGSPQIAQVIAPSIGCREFEAFAYGLDLAAICPADG